MSVKIADTLFLLLHVVFFAGAFGNGRMVSGVDKICNGGVMALVPGVGEGDLQTTELCSVFGATSSSIGAAGTMSSIISGLSVTYDGAKSTSVKMLRL